MGVHFLGGNGVARVNVYDINPVHVQMPSFSAGCGGIDYTLGGLNIASKDEMKKALKSIASNGVGYAFLLGIETVSPLVSSSMKQIQTWANQLNAININSCELSSSLVQGMWPKSQAASSYICEHATTHNPLFTDLIEAKHGCRDDKSKRQAAIGKVRENNDHIFVGSYNIAWKALSEMDLDETTKCLFLNVTGTIVVVDTMNNGKEEKEIRVFPPQYKKAMDLLRFGGTMEKAYKMDEDKINVKLVPLEINPDKSWKNKVLKTLKSIQGKILNESKNEFSELDQEEMNLIKSTHFPIGSLISLMSQYSNKGSMIAIDRYSDLIAFERVLHFTEEVIKDTLSKAEALRAAQINGYELDEYIKQAQGILKDIQALNIENYHQISAEHQVIDYMIKIDRTMRDKERGV